MFLSPCLLCDVAAFCGGAFCLWLMVSAELCGEATANAGRLLSNASLHDVIRLWMCYLSALTDLLMSSSIDERYFHQTSHPFMLLDVNVSDSPQLHAFSSTRSITSCFAVPAVTTATLLRISTFRNR